MPYPDSYVTRHVRNRLIYDELDYNADTERENFHNLFTNLKYEQRSIFDKIMEAVDKQRGGVFFLHGYGGTGGRTAHSKFKITMPTLDNSTCNVDKDTEHSQLFEATDVIIWDEAPMALKNCFEALDKTLKDVMDVGDGKICEPNDGLADIEIPQEILISNFEDPIKAIVESTYFNLLENFQNVDILQGKAILASTIRVVKKINHYVLDMIPGEEEKYLSFDSIDRTYTSYNETYEVLTPEFLSKLRTSGLPNHKIKLKVGIPIMLTRNLDQNDGLCN
ncbi:uncharacterized protein LOC131624208 [Vicia villosa]|uniref:uncharacterized protein LOC131624208 n=1 Tax=Vicia villosa TaxID=3911 RepID=UPI00273B2718|nr:uncharacterized protein LOC131624208 [Vicia villosa]